MSSDHYYPMFEHMLDNHGVTLLDSEIDDIFAVVHATDADEARENERLNSALAGGEGPERTDRDNADRWEREARQS